MKSILKKWIAGSLVAGLMATGIVSSGQPVSAETVYTYKDELSSFTIEGSGIRISGTHVVWRSRAAKYAGQIYYGNTDTGQKLEITNHGKPTDTPVVGVNGKGEPIVVWADKRDQNEGVGNLNWDIYSYNVKTKTESKLNTDVGQNRIPSIDGDYIVWQTNPQYEMYLYDLANSTLKDLGKGRDPVIKNGRIVYKGGSDGDLYEYVISSGTVRKLLDLPYTSYVERFVFNGEEILWKQRDLDRNGKYVFLDLGVSNPQPVDLTQPVALGKTEYAEMSISGGTAAWLEASGDKAIVRSADLATGNLYSLGVIAPSQFIGFNGEDFALVNNGRLVSREIISSDSAASTTGAAGGTGGTGGTGAAGSTGTGVAALQPEGDLIGPSGGVAAGGQAVRLVFEPGTFGKDTRVVLKPSEAATAPNKEMTWLGVAWTWTSEAKLNKPALLTIELEQAAATADRANRTGLYRYNGDTGKWSYAGGTFDVSWRNIRTQVQEPGLYALFLYEPSFADMKIHWAKDEVEVLASKWIVNGMNTGRFEPGQSVTRAQFAKMLVEATGLRSQTKGTASFKDVPAGHWASDAVEQAAAAGWIKGYEGSLFKPNASITREEMMVMLTNAASLRKEEQSEALNAYADAAKVHSWAQPSVLAAIKSGLIQGNGDRLNPRATCTRAEAAAVIYRWLGKKGEVFQ
ncbi:S-layer homology domain-containing protein [Paenibacillus sophorae]|uniref:S-layer homology domain-containing protein n=1 Tax=Paenibacillus sophorae TaxID=1333845 RepID=A0A1H8SU85_9BACL|nr:S-layer homology domain-containing protein [Paenibacillus sophorae]QWU15563.1 S-layer homology domain-containing protein [Paenibacillus sophorae]SEO82115.1 S-layer homology domain-containing protein [Paenibacillus sophorae]